VPTERIDDQHDAQAQATIYAIAANRRENESLRQERNQLFDLNASANATIRAHEDTIRELREEIARQKALTDSWQHEAARLQSIIEVAAASLMQAVQREEGGAS
jgi:hypothetical protein